METPLNAREFLKRFHLPQLVRLSTINTNNNDTLESCANEDECQDGKSISLRISTTSSSLSALSANRAKQQQQHQDRKRQENYHEPSNWTYRRPINCETEQREVEDYDASWTSEQELSCHELEQSGSRSLQVLETSNLHDDDLSSNGRGEFCSISAWSSVQVDRMLERRQKQQQQQQQQQRHQQAVSLDPADLLVRVPRASLIQQQQHNINKSKTTRAGGCRKSVEFTDERRMMRRDLVKDEFNDEGTSIEQSIRLTPPSKRPTLSKLQLNQPFLLYKAYKKLELCAFVIDPKNELNDKSGDPIYFPQNYPGWFTLLDSHDHHFGNSRRKPLETIDQVCRTNAQIFITRDELVGYQLPSKLSHLTKLKNNQLLALPLAINLEKNKSRDKSKKRSNGSQSEYGKGKGKGKGNGKANGSKGEKTSISDIKQVVIECGQALKICGIYEDVLPLIERKQQQQQQQFHELAKHRVERTIRYEQSPFQQQQFYSYPTCQQEQQQHLDEQQLAGHYQKSGVYQTVGINGYQGANQQRIFRTSQTTSVKDKITKLRATEYGGFSGGHHEASQLVYAAQPLTRQQRVGQRYARCILLSQRSVDELTDCVYRSSTSGRSKQNINELEDEDHEEEKSDNLSVLDDEIEVLIPIEQRGRFYLCATNQTILNEFGLMGNCNLCTSSQALPISTSASNSLVVFKLSQIIYLLNLSRRLLLARRGTGGGGGKSADGSAGDQGRRGRAFTTSSGVGTAGVRLPLSVELVLGPRPAHFSPSMFGGSSSSMESYFRCESNVAGHSLDCSYNRNFAGRGSSAGLLGMGAAGKGAESTTRVTHEQVVVGVACPCALSLRRSGGGGVAGGLKGKKSYGLFSASLRFEQLTKRDVLLACTIKKDPLVHLDLFGGIRTNEEDNPPSSLLCCENSSSSSSSSNDGTSSTHFRYPHMAVGGSADWRQLRSHRLAALRESPNPRTKGEQENSGSFKALGKSSFRRLRACRSLISLNGRRKKRPKIPSSMLSATSSSAYSSDEAPTGGAATTWTDGLTSGSRLELVENINNNNDSLASSRIQFGGHQDGGGNSENIVLLEFDCNEGDLYFVRTFVESSIPTSRIPDLVLKRMDFCHRNSLDWERQLKLSYVSLSSDFDSCRRQMELNMRRNYHNQYDHSCNRVSVGRRLLAVSERNLHDRRQRLSATATMSSSSMSLAKSSSTTRVKRADQLTDSRFQLTCSESANSTASSSRSSSGVSSSNERVVSNNNNNNNNNIGTKSASEFINPNTTTLLGSRVSFIKGGQNSTTSSSSISSVNLKSNKKKNLRATGSSRLLRLVHRILPLSGRLNDEQEDENEDEGSLSETSGKSMIVRRMRLTGSDQMDISLELDEFADQLQLQAQQQQELNSSSSSLKDEDGDDDDEGSHLYESLERLSEKLKRVGLTNRSMMLAGTNQKSSTTS